MTSTNSDDASASVPEERTDVELDLGVDAARGTAVCIAVLAVSALLAA